ncbi:MAG: hypothetical protein HYZ37_18765 [Candidatus Solibacter usitatus]|nr:hypothetical protein [Candidatus Solibacter usitatus]
MKLKNILFKTTVAALVAVPLTFAQTYNTTGTTTVSVTVGAEAALYIDTSTTSMTTSATTFANYTGTTNLHYKIRTTTSGGTGTITARVTSDFSPANGPSVASPPTAGDTLAYTCTVSSPGTGCSGSQTSSTSSDTSIATFGADAHSAAAGNTGALAWTLTNDPQYKTGTYTATVTFTVSST